MLQRLTSPFREFGLGAGFLYALGRLLGRVSSDARLHVYEMMVQPITEKPLLPGQLGKQLEVREIKPGDPEIARMPVRPDVMAARLRQNTTCLGAFRRGEFIGYMWFCRDSYEEDEVRCTYVLGSPRESVFDFDFYIFPEHRMGLAFVGLWNAANAFLYRAGVRYTFSRLTRFNVASRRAHQHLGWKVVGRVVFVQLGRFECMLGTIFPYVHMSPSTSGRARLTLRPDRLLRE